VTAVVRDHEGEVGNRGHITRTVHGTIPTHVLAEMPGSSGEVPGEHRNRLGDQWIDFLVDIWTHGIVEPIFVTVDYGHDPRINEGNHRRDAAVALGLAEVPVEIRYFGHAERHEAVALAG
jgi:hypothetical protein